MIDARMLCLLGYGCLVVSGVLLGLSVRVFGKERVRDAYESVWGQERKERAEEDEKR